jgi:hypothetical protein
MHRRILAAVLLTASFALPAHAAWTPNGVALSLAANVQFAPLAVPDGQGGAYVVWLDTRSGNTDLYAQHVTSTGAIAAGWLADGRAVCADASTQGPPQIAADGLGNAYVTWSDPRSGGPDVYLQKLVSGGIAPGWPANGLLVCGAIGGQINPALIADANGALVAWSDSRGATEDLYVHHVLPAGALDGAWPAAGAILSGANQQQAFPTIVTDGAGGAIVAWEDGRNGGGLSSQLDIYAGHMRAIGAADSTWGANGTVLCLSTGFDQTRPLAVSDGAGGAIVVWNDQRNGNGDLYATRVLGTGAIAGGWPVDGAEVAKAAGEQILPAIVSDGAGGAIFAWQDGRDPVGFPSNTDVYAVRLQPNGTRPAGWAANGNNLSVQLPDRQGDPAICSDGAGGALVAWKDGRPGAELYAQHVQADGAIAPGWAADGNAICTALEQQVDPTLVSDGAGGGLVAWEDYRNSIANHDIYAQRFLGSGQVGPVVGVGELAPGTLALAFAGAHPARGDARFAITLPADADATADVYNPAGRRVARVWSGGIRPAGRHVAAWDGRDGSGRTAPPGMYYLEVIARGRRAALRFVFLP